METAVMLPALLALIVIAAHTLPALFEHHDYTWGCFGLVVLAVVVAAFADTLAHAIA